MTPPNVPLQPSRSPPWLLIIIGGIILTGLITAAFLFSSRKAEETKVVVDYDQQMRLLQTKQLLRERIGGDITRAGQSYGFCRASCDSFFPDGGATQSWQFVAPGAVLLVFLFVREDFTKTLPEYWLKFQWSSSRDDGDLAPVAPRLQELLDTLLKRFNYPSEFLWPTPRDRAARGSSTYNAMDSRYRPALGHIYHHTGHESLRGERVANITRKGPFTEEGSWLREK